MSSSGAIAGLIKEVKNAGDIIQDFIRSYPQVLGELKEKLPSP